MEFGGEIRFNHLVYLGIDSYVNVCMSLYVYVFESQKDYVA